MYVTVKDKINKKSVNFQLSGFKEDESKKDFLVSRRLRLPRGRTIFFVLASCSGTCRAK
jgi:hypothetical protein